jgi:hypothetical protein
MTHTEAAKLAESITETAQDIELWLDVSDTPDWPEIALRLRTLRMCVARLAAHVAEQRDATTRPPD